jgi:hypothetical protein
MFTNRNLIIAMAVCQGITALCAIFVAVRVALVSIDSYGDVGTAAYIRNLDAITVRVQNMPVAVRIDNEPIKVRVAP